MNEGSSQTMRFSIIIPARNEERFIVRCLKSIRAAARSFAGEIEIVVSLNRCTDRTEEIAKSYGAVIVRNDSKNLSMIRNAGAKAAHGDIIVTIDADSWMSPNMLTEIDRFIRSGRYIGGGVMMYPERLSLGIISTILLIFPVILMHRVISGGLFWCLRSDFEAIQGFDESLVSVEDIDFARRLRIYGKTKRKRLATITKAHIMTSCRKFDIFGDWYILKNPRLTHKIFQGRDEKAANGFFYDVPR
ncbi:MAG: glycosyltransferase [Pseudomonadota bacterium]